jgi:hypothetical protein
MGYQRLARMVPASQEVARHGEGEGRSATGLEWR